MEACGLIRHTRMAAMQVGEGREAWGLVDWHRPWLAGVAQAGRPAVARILAGASVAQALNEALEGDRAGADARGAMRFVAHESLEHGVAYERFIDEQCCIPTRDNLHDFLNGLIWLHFPRTKRLFNRWQADAIRQRGAGGTRGPLRDAITVFDENGALLLAPQPLCEALRERAWHRLGVQLRPLWREARLIPFGHALLEKLVQPRKSITAHVVIADEGGRVQCASTGPDAWMASHFTREWFAQKPFNPLPVLGVPGWWSENENFCFYDDSMVFRSDARKIIQQPEIAAAAR